jgi:hypothetical protein
VRAAPRATLLLALALIVAGGLGCTTAKPLTSHEVPLDPATASRARTAEWLRTCVGLLAGPGERSTRRPGSLSNAAALLVGVLSGAGIESERLDYACEDQILTNLEVAMPGSQAGAPTIVIGAHYDSAAGTPGADDNASGCAALLELARRFDARHKADAGFPRHTLRLVFFTNEEPPWFQGEHMGSLVHARALAARGEHVSAMLAFDGLGYYDDRAGSQHYPPPFSLAYPDTANFLGFVGDLSSGALVRRCVDAFRASGALPCEGLSTFGALQGVGWSDHWSYWQIGVPAVMVTDTALFRNANYHEPTDRPDTLDYERLARAVEGIEAVVLALDVELD